jgi:hypothetical protein
MSCIIFSHHLLNVLLQIANKLGLSNKMYNIWSERECCIFGSKMRWVVSVTQLGASLERLSSKKLGTTANS